MKKYDYFITLTFSEEYRGFRDKAKTELFEKFISKLKDFAPQIQYIAIPEYTHNGGLHFHLLTSGIIPQDIQCVRKAIRCGKWFYEVLPWSYGYSTMVRLDKAVTK